MLIYCNTVGHVSGRLSLATIGASTLPESALQVRVKQLFDTYRIDPTGVQADVELFLCQPVIGAMLATTAEIRALASQSLPPAGTVDRHLHLRRLTELTGSLDSRQVALLVAVLAVVSHVLEGREAVGMPDPLAVETVAALGHILEGLE
jgi:hypothetical protein